MRTMKRILCVLLVTVLLCGALPLSATAASKSVVQKRIEAIAKIYPQNSAFDEWVQVGRHDFWIQEYGGCSGLMAYVTKKVFGTPYCCKNCGGYTSIGSAATSNTAAMKKLFAKAKLGDVIEWTKGSQVAHHAIFQSDNANGVKLYEANFSGPNRVWYNHQWPWYGMKTWPAGGADKVTVLRADNYNAVNKGKSAKEPAKGKVYTLDTVSKLKVQVVTSAIGNSYAVVKSGYKKGTKLPTYVGLYDGGYAQGIYDKAQYKAADANTFRIFKVVKVPGASSKVTAKVSKTSVKLTWKKVSGADGYRVYRYDTKTKKYVTVKSGTTATSLTVKGLKKGTRYKFAVKAYKKVGGTRVWAEKGKSLTATTKKK